MDIYKALAEKRISLGISRYALAKQLGISRSGLKLAEDGKPKAHTLEKVCEWAAALGLEIVVRCKDDS